MTENAVQLEPDPHGRFGVRKVAAACGAETNGVDLSTHLDDATFQAVHDALIQHEVNVFRDQDMTAEDQKAFGRRFGDLTVHPFAPSAADTPELIVFDTMRTTLPGAPMSGIRTRHSEPSRRWAPCCAP
jgi:taurine dioxygenase